MGIKTGSGGGHADKSGRRKSGVGRQSPPSPIRPGQPQKPFRPLESTFPQKDEFRLGQFQVLEEKDDYLICKGFDPNAKNPFSEITPSAFRKIKVAKPPALQRTPWDGKEVTIGDIEYTYEYSDDEYGVRTASWTEDGELREEEQRISIPYTLDDDEVADQIIVAVEIKKNAAVDGMDVTDEEGTRLRWIDLNVSGRRWKATVTDSDDDGFPPGTGMCKCDNCLEGVTIQDGTECCKGHLNFSLKNPWLVCEDTDLTLEYIDNDTWLTEAFTGPDCDSSETVTENTYKWRLMPDVDGISYLDLVLVTDNGCSDVCVRYWREGFDCQCNNELFLEKPNGYHINVPRKQLSCYVCLQFIHRLFQFQDGCPISGSREESDLITNETNGNTYCLKGVLYRRDAIAGIWEYESCTWVSGSVGGTYALLATTRLLEYPSGLTWLYICDEQWSWHTNGLPFCGGSYVAIYRMFPSLFDESTAGTKIVGDSSWADLLTLTETTGCDTPDPGSPSDTGACEDAACTDTPEPTDPDRGGCCFQDRLYDYWDEALCDLFLGDWYDDKTEAECFQLGVCCFDGLCFKSDSTVCDQFVNGEAVGSFVAGGTCPDSCPEPSTSVSSSPSTSVSSSPSVTPSSSASSTPSSSPSASSSPSSSASSSPSSSTSGTPSSSPSGSPSSTPSSSPSASASSSPSSSASSSPSSAGDGACCGSSDTCSVVSESTCDADGGWYFGDDTNCDGVACSGVCCEFLAFACSCINGTAADCAANSGDYVDNTDCTTHLGAGNECRAPIPCSWWP